MRSFVRRVPLTAVAASLLFAVGLSVKAEEPALPNLDPPKVADSFSPKPRALYHTVHLGMDGNLTGTVNLIDSEAQYVPAVVTLNFVQNGLIIAETLTGEGGNFQVLDFVPGVYSVIVSGSDGLGVVRVHVAAYDADVAEDQNTLDITLIPAVDIELLISGTGGGSAGGVGGGGVGADGAGGGAGGGVGGGVTRGGGGGGGGGGGIGGVGSVAGLAGLAALAGRSRRPDFVVTPWFIAPPFR